MDARRCSARLRVKHDAQRATYTQGSTFSQVEAGWLHPSTQHVRSVPVCTVMETDVVRGATQSPAAVSCSGSTVLGRRWSTAIACTCPHTSARKCIPLWQKDVDLSPRSCST